MPKPMNRRDFARRAAAFSVAPGMLSAFATSDFAMAQQKFVPNYDESKVSQYELPDPLVAMDGSAVATAQDWAARRAEILGFYREQVYGRVPEKAPPVVWDAKQTRKRQRAAIAELASKLVEEHAV